MEILIVVNKILDWGSGVSADTTGLWECCEWQLMSIRCEASTCVNVSDGFQTLLRDNFHESIEATFASKIVTACRKLWSPIASAPHTTTKREPLSKAVLSTQTMSLPLSVYIGSNKRYSWVVCLVWCLDSWATWYLKHPLQTRERKKVSRWSNFLVVLAYQPYSFIKLFYVSLTSDSGCGGNWLW